MISLTALLSLALTLMVASAPALAEKSGYLALAKKGWNYQLRQAMRRDRSIPVHINGRDLAGVGICIVGEEPHAQTALVLDAFIALLEHSFGQPVRKSYAGQKATSCGSGRFVILRLYSGYPPNAAFSSDLQWLSEIYRIGLPKGREYAVSSPAQAQTYFGRLGHGTHIMVKQPALAQLGALEEAFYTSILLEELYQSFSFGMDVLLFDQEAEFLSKLQETHMNLQRFPWGSRAFMRALLSSNPMRLCAFDVFMLHAIAQAPVDQTNEPEFIDFLDDNYEVLRAQSAATLADPRFAGIIDQTCARRR